MTPSATTGSSSPGHALFFCRVTTISRPGGYRAGRTNRRGSRQAQSRRNVIMLPIQPTAPQLVATRFGPPRPAGPADKGHWLR
jgi:hypothetical protein